MTTYDQYIILHGCPPTEAMVTPKEKRWMNWLEKELKERGLNAIAPDLPFSWNPKYAQWKRLFEEYHITENTCLIGHSCGGSFFVRWLLETKKTVKKLILVAPAKIPETEDDTRKDLYDFDLPEDASHIAKKIVLITSNDFPHHIKSRELYKKSLRPRVVELKDKGHFLFFQMGINEFPELLDEVLS